MTDVFGTYSNAELIIYVIYNMKQTLKSDTLVKDAHKSIDNVN